MKKLVLHTVDNYDMVNKYAKILSLSNKYDSINFSINSWSAILDIYYVGSFGQYGIHAQYAISWQSKNLLKIVQLTEDIEHKIQDNVLAYVPTEEGLDLYVASLYNSNSALQTRIEVLAFSDTGIWYDNANFIDISSLNPVYYEYSRETEIINSNINKSNIDSLLFKRTYVETNSIDIDLSLLGSSSGTFFIEFRTFTNSASTSDKIKGIDIICNNGDITTKNPYTEQNSIAVSFNSSTNIITLSNFGARSFIFYTATRL